jgi:hypothetical protein
MWIDTTSKNLYMEINSMNKKLFAASIILFIISGVTIFFGLVNLLSPKLVGYQQNFLGMTHEQLPPRIAALYLIFMRTLGASFLSLGVCIAMLVKGAFMKGVKLSWWIILVMSLVLLLPLLCINFSVGFYSPWPVTSLMLILLITAMTISKSSMS